MRALGDSTNQAGKKNGNKAPRSDPWSFLDESTKLEREITKREREEERKARERVAMAMAEDHISKIDEYYAKAAEAARQRNAGDDGPNPEIVMVAHNVSLASRPPPSPMSRPLMSSTTEPRRSWDTCTRTAADPPMEAPGRRPGCPAVDPRVR